MFALDPNHTPNRNYFSNSPNEPVYAKKNTAPPQDISQFYSNPYTLTQPQTMHYEYFAQTQLQPRLSEHNSPQYMNDNNNMERNFHKGQNHHHDHHGKRALSQGIDRHISVIYRAK